MPESGSRAGVFEAISAVALLFMVLGIAIAVIQWVSYSEDPPPVLRGVDPASVQRISIDDDDSSLDDDDTDTGADGGAEESGSGDAPKPGKAGEGDDKAPGVGEEGMEF